MASLRSHRVENVLVGLHIVVKKISVGHINRLLAVIPLHHFWRTCNLIRNDVINVLCSGCTTKPHELYLYRSWPQRKDILSSARGPAVEIEQELYVLFINE